MNNDAKEERGQKEKLSLGEFFVMCSLFLRWFVKYMWGSRKMRSEERRVGKEC